MHKDFFARTIKYERRDAFKGRHFCTIVKNKLIKNIIKQIQKKISYPPEVRGNSNSKNNDKKITNESYY